MKRIFLILFILAMVGCKSTKTKVDKKVNTTKDSIITKVVRDTVIKRDTIIKVKTVVKREKLNISADSIIKIKDNEITKYYGLNKQKETNKKQIKSLNRKISDYKSKINNLQSKIKEVKNVKIDKKVKEVTNSFWRVLAFIGWGIIVLFILIEYVFKKLIPIL